MANKDKSLSQQHHPPPPQKKKKQKEKPWEVQENNRKCHVEVLNCL